MKKAFYLLLALLACVVSFFAGRRQTDDDPSRDTVVTVEYDTVRYSVVDYVYDTIVKHDVVRLPVARNVAAAREPREGKPPDELPVMAEQDKPDEANRANIEIASADSVDVEIPITQRMYEGESYRAWVSGYNPRLDSIETYNTRTTIRLPKEIPKKWHIGVTGGWGMTPKGMQPFVGVGVTYSLISF